MNKLFVWLGSVILIFSVLFLGTYAIDYIQLYDFGFIWNRLPEEIILPSFGSITVLGFVLRVAWIVYKQYSDYRLKTNSDIAKEKMAIEREKIALEIDNRNFHILQAKAIINNEYSTPEEVELYQNWLDSVEISIVDEVLEETSNIIDTILNTDTDDIKELYKDVL